MHLPTLHPTGKNESGQTSAEYTAVTAAAVVIAITVAWVVLTGTITSAINTLGDELFAFADKIVT
jgi:hypothetical protein